MKEQIQEFIADYVNPGLATHGGFLEIVDFDEKTGDMSVRMGGGCQGCDASSETLYVQIEAFLREEFPKLGAIIDVTDHDAGTKPHFKRK